MMPYIMKEMRPAFDIHLDNIGPHTTSAGDLNYCISRLVGYYIKSHGKSYTTMNDCIGVLEAAKLELYRRLTAPYEDVKIKENGDVDLYIELERK